jgi:hypothetical protein
MNPTDLQTLYRWLWPFQPDKRDYNSETENPMSDFANSIDVIRGGMPDLFWEALQAGHSRGVVETNNVLLSMINNYEFANTDSICDLSRCGIQIVGYGSGYSYLERDAKGNLTAPEESRQFVESLNTPLWAFWEFLWSPDVIPSKQCTPGKYEIGKLIDLAKWLTGMPIPRQMWDDPPLPEPETERQALGWMIAWTISATGNEALDHLNDEIMDNGYYTQWDAGELEGVVRLSEECDTLMDFIQNGCELYMAHQAAIQANIVAIMKGANCDACTWPF